MAKGKKQGDANKTESSDTDEESEQASGGKTSKDAEEAARWREARKKGDENLKALREQREREEASGARRKSVFPPRIPQWRREIHEQWKEEDEEIAKWKKAREEGKASLVKLREEREKAGPSGAGSATSTKIPQWRKEIYEEWKRKEEEEAKWRKARENAKSNLSKLREERAKAGDAKGSGSSATKIPQWRKEIYEQWEREDAEQAKWKKAKEAAKSSLAKLHEERENAPRRKSVFPPRIPQWRKEIQEQWDKEDAAAAKWRGSRQKADAALSSQKDVYKKREAKAEAEAAAKAIAAAAPQTPKKGPGQIRRSVTSIPIGGARRKVPSASDVMPKTQTPGRQTGGSRSRIPIPVSSSATRLTHQAEMELKKRLETQKAMLMAKARKKADADLAVKSSKLQPKRSFLNEPTKAQKEAMEAAERVARMQKAKAEATARSRAGAKKDAGGGAAGRGAGRGRGGTGKRQSTEAVPAKRSSPSTSSSKLKRSGSLPQDQLPGKRGRGRRESSPL